MTNINMKNNKKGYWIVKAPKALREKLDYVANQRVRLGKDNKSRSYNRMLLAISRQDKWVSDLINADFIEDKRAQMNFSVFNIFTFMIVCFMAVVLFGGLIYVSGLLNDVFLDVGLKNEGNAGRPGYTNLTVAAQNTFGKMDSSIQALRLVAITLIFSELMFFVLALSFQRAHPAMFFVYILIIFLAVMLAAPISNSYESLLGSNIYEGNLQSFTGANWFLLNLPIVVLLAGILGAIFLFINIMRSGNEQVIT